MRKIETINKLRELGLKVAEAKEFKASQLKEMIEWANQLINKYGSFNLRTDLPAGVKAGFNLPFIRKCSISNLISKVKEYGDRITYIVHQDIDTSNQLFNGVLRLHKGLIIGEINETDKTSLRAGMKNTKNIKQVIDEGSNQIFMKIKQDLIKAGQEAWFELTAYNNGEIIYWQIIPEKINDEIANKFKKK